jgi:hypothetical protein
VADEIWVDPNTHITVSGGPNTQRDLDRARAEIERLKREGVPGVMHEVDQSFYDLAVKERNYARLVAENRIESDNRLHWLREQILKVISDHRPGSYAPVDVFSDGELIEQLRCVMGML